MEPYNYFKFKHIDDGTTHSVSFNSMYVGDVIDNFVLFLLGCGHAAKPLYEHMAEIADQYFEVELKKEEDIKNLD